MRTAAPATRSKPAQRGSNPGTKRRALILGGAALLVAVIAAALYWFVIRDSGPDGFKPEAVDGVSLVIDTCTVDGGSATLRNENTVAMQFAAAVDFIDGAGTILYPVRISVDLEPGAERSVQMPFGGEIADPDELSCQGALVNVVPRDG